MNELYIDGNWDQKKRRLQRNFEGLQDQDLHYVEGKEDELVAQIGKRLGLLDYEVRKIIRIA